MNVCTFSEWVESFFPFVWTEDGKVSRKLADSFCINCAVAMVGIGKPKFLKILSALRGNYDIVEICERKPRSYETKILDGSAVSIRLTTIFQEMVNSYSCTMPSAERVLRFPANDKLHYVMEAITFVWFLLQSYYACMTLCIIYDMY